MARPVSVEAVESGELWRGWRKLSIECIYRYMFDPRILRDARWIRSDGTVRIAWIVLPNDYAATAVLSRAIGDGRRVSGHSAAVLVPPADWYDGVATGPGQRPVSSPLRLGISLGHCLPILEGKTRGIQKALRNTGIKKRGPRPSRPSFEIECPYPFRESHRAPRSR